MDTDSDGNTKLILDGYYEETSGTPYTMGFGSNNTFSLTTGIGKKLNSDVLEWLVASNDMTNRNKLVNEYNWYQNSFDYGYDFDYKISLNEKDPNRIIVATVGLIRVGELLSSQSSSLLTKGYTVGSSINNINEYWTMTSASNSSTGWIAEYGKSASYGINNNSGIRPVIIINCNATIFEGNGTWSNPYQI